MLSTITSKGQVTIPVEVRRAVGLEVGMQVEFIVNHRRRVEIVPRHGDIRTLRGSVPPPSSPVAVDDMNAVIAEGWASSRPQSRPAKQGLHGDELTPGDCLAQPARPGPR